MRLDQVCKWLCKSASVCVGMCDREREREGVFALEIIFGNQRERIESFR